MNMTSHHITHFVSGKEELDIIWKLLKQVPDPEVPVLSILDLGIVRDVKINSRESDKEINIVITPTYSGCPAMDMISMNIRLALMEYGYKNVMISYVLSPAWTTDWMSDEGKRKLKEYGIAPPHRSNEPANEIQCPHCNSTDTKLLSQFGSTACKALYQCNDCREPFDYFKCH
jgi:ring-1,2-phenylacetyl-CoA epoxidase subunit PaaD